jgi:hypothetical protein
MTPEWVRTAGSKTLIGIESRSDVEVDPFDKLLEISRYTPQTS